MFKIIGCTSSAAVACGLSAINFVFRPATWSANAEFSLRLHSSSNSSATSSAVGFNIGVGMLPHNKMYREVKDQNQTERLPYVLSKHIWHPYMTKFPILQYRFWKWKKQIYFRNYRLPCHNVFSQDFDGKDKLLKINNDGNDKTYTYLSKYSNTATMCLQVPDSSALHEHFICMISALAALSVIVCGKSVMPLVCRTRLRISLILPILLVHPTATI